MKELMELATRVARKMWNDPEGESAAGLCLLKALQSFDPRKGVPLKAYVVACVRMGVLYEQRRRSKLRDTCMSEAFWREVYDSVGTAKVPPNVELLLSDEHTQRVYRIPAEHEEVQDDWKMLIEHFVDRLPMDIMARRRGITVYRLRKLLHAAESKYRTKSNADTLR